MLPGRASLRLCARASAGASLWPQVRLIHATFVLCRRPRTQGEAFAQLLREKMEEEMRKSNARVRAPRYQENSHRRGLDPKDPYGRPFAYEDMPMYMQSNQASSATSFTQNHPRLVLIVLAVGGASIYYVCHLEQVPSTGRWQFIDMSPKQEWQMGQQAYQGVLQQYQGRLLPSWTKAHVQVERVANRIIQACNELDMHRAVGAPPSQWTVHVIHAPQEKNAFVLPGGHIFVFTGILPVCRHDAGLATVMSHEVAHQIARHSAEKMSGSKVLMALAFVMDMLGFDVGLSRIALNLMLSLPNSRKIESEADELGLRIMSKACYDPREAVQFWQRMNIDDGDSGALADSAKQLLSTHPVNTRRIANIKHWLPRAKQIYDESHCSATATALDAMRAAARPA